MRDHSEKQSGLADLRLQFNSPLTLQMFIHPFKEYLKEAGNISDKSWGEDNLKEYLIETINRFFEVVNLGAISEETDRIEKSIKSIRKEKYIKFDMFDNGSYAEANNLLQDIYTKWNDVQLRKEVCSDHITLIRKAINYLSSLKKIITLFIQEDKLHGIEFKNLATAKRFTEIITLDIDSYIEILKGQIQEISSWVDHSLTAKINMLMKADSSLRLLSKYAEWDKDYNSKQGDTAPKKYGSDASGDFNVEAL